MLSPRILTLILDVRVSPGSDNLRVNVLQVPSGSCHLAAWKKQAFIRERLGTQTQREPAQTLSTGGFCLNCLNVNMTTFKKEIEFKRTESVFQDKVCMKVSVEVSLSMF